MSQIIPADAEAFPDTSKLTSTSKKRWALGLMILAVLFGLGYLFYPLYQKLYQDRSYYQTEENAKQIYMLLADFEQDYGQLPDTTTESAVQNTSGTKTSMAGTSSNSLLRQLIVGGYVQSEGIFFAKGKATKKPDNVITDGKALALGECGFAYITGQTTKAAPGTPILAAPMIPGTTKFDRTIFNGKVVILRMGGSTKELTIAEDGHVYENGKDIFDPAQPWWGGKAPVIAYPE